MTTRMAHPQHGFTHAYDTGEIQRLRSFGWVPEDELISQNDELDELTSIEVLPPADRPKRGRPAKAK